MYNATARLEDGSVLSVSGTFDECIKWYEEVVRNQFGSVDFQIKQDE